MVLSGCGNVAKIHYIIYGLLAISIIPVTMWSIYNHRQYRKRENIKDKQLFVYRLSITIYVGTFIESLLSASTTFGACYLSRALWDSIWFFYCICFVFNWAIFLLLLFSRYIVIKSSMISPFRCCVYVDTACISENI